MDPIDRQAAIDVVSKECMEFRGIFGRCKAALKALPSAQPEIKTDGDTISRQAAIDALIKWYGCEPSDIGAFENIIEKLPSAQSDIIRCKDCKHRYIENEVWACPFGLAGGPDFYCGYGAEGRTDETD